MFRLKHFLEQSWLLIVSSFLFGLLIAVTNAALSPRIEQNRINKLNDRARALLPGVERFMPVEAEIVIKSGGRAERIDVYKAESKPGECVGWTFSASGPGFIDKIELVVAVDGNFEKLAGFDVLASSETARVGDQIKEPFFREQFVGAPVGDLIAVRSGDTSAKDEKIVTISGATITSEAVVEIISSSAKQIKKELQKKGLIGDGENR
ncbi:MAG: FMN-binding protein [Phycisphaerales bacterium]|nr:MAG: FMN-binding protein [Phycisphaerales bacterium]